MAHEGTITSLRYLKRQNLQPVMQIQRDYYREQIYSYGTDAIYFRHDANPYSYPSGTINYDYVYGEDTTKTYFLSAPIVIFMEIQGDSVLLNKFGIETDGDADCYFLIDDFTEGFRDKIGIAESDNFVSTVSGTISGWAGIVSGSVSNSELNGFISADVFLSGNPSGSVSYLFSESFNRTPVPHNSYTYRTTYYTSRTATGNLSGVLTGVVDLSGNGYLNGTTSGNISYFTDETNNTAYNQHWDIAPQVGDFFRLDFNDDNHEEYEITKVVDRNLQPDGLNPHLYKYVWQMSVVRRDPSFETIISVSADIENDEEYTTEREEFNIWSDTISNEIFDYSQEEVDTIDTTDSDDVYGGYGYNNDS